MLAGRRGQLVLRKSWWRSRTARHRCPWPGRTGLPPAFAIARYGHATESCGAPISKSCAYRRREPARSRSYFRARTCHSTRVTSVYPVVTSTRSCVTFCPHALAHPLPRKPNAQRATESLLLLGSCSTKAAVLPRPPAGGLANAIAIQLKARLRLVSMVATHAEGEPCVCGLTEPIGLRLDVESL